MKSFWTGAIAVAGADFIGPMLPPSVDIAGTLPVRAAVGAVAGAYAAGHLFKLAGHDLSSAALFGVAALVAAEFGGRLLPMLPPIPIGPVNVTRLALGGVGGWAVHKVGGVSEASAPAAA